MAAPNKQLALTFALALADLLLANLRLLDLDRRADWPHVTPKTFSTKDTQQNQKQRIKSTEWILYRLFELWDPDETRDKLQPFFPPLEPLQSLNLRAALFRALNELKKNGVLGRESVLRKTMLDECKGDKLLELLVIFSTRVLRRVDASRQRIARSTAERIALAPVLSPAQQGSLIPLTIAHAASLGNVLRRREQQRERYARFAELLDGKRGQLRQRVKASVQQQKKRRESNVDEEAQVKKVALENWADGNSTWLHALLSGDDANAGDVPLQKPFPEVWAAVSQGRALGDDVASLGLLASLDRRVQVQKERLQMWQEFHEGLREPHHHARLASEHIPPEPKFRFDRHQRLQLGSTHNNGDGAIVASEGPNAYASIVGTLRIDVSNASKSRRHGGAGWTSKPEGVMEYRSHDLFSPIKGPGVDYASARPQPLTKPFKTTSILDDGPSLLAPTMKPELNGFKIKRFGRNDSKTDTSLPQKAEAATIRDEPPRPETPEMETPIRITQASPMHEEPTAADRIIASAVAATPSPVKQHMSLTDRTRMSMAFLNGTKEPSSLDSGIAIPSTSASVSASTSDNDDDAVPTVRARPGPLGGGDVQRRVSLLERTRLSMAALPTHVPSSRKSIHARRSSRQSLFPVNQFETPGKPRQLPEPRRDTTPTERLFSEEAEYASVFKSRPRVALSPVPFTPEVGDADGSGISEGEGLDVRDASEDGRDDEHDDGFASSPLVGRKRLAAG